MVEPESFEEKFELSSRLFYCTSFGMCTTLAYFVCSDALIWYIIVVLQKRCTWFSEFHDESTVFYFQKKLTAQPQPTKCSISINLSRL